MTTTQNKKPSPPGVVNPAHPTHHGHPGIVNASEDPYLSGPFAPVVDELDLANLTVIGELPEELDGVYLRNGPNPRFTPIGSYMYPLDGDGMVHAIRISDKGASYSNRFVRTAALQVEERAGRALWPGLLSGPPPTAEEVGPELAGKPREMPDINIVRHSGRILALAESTCPYTLTTGLDTVRKETFDGHLPAGMTAHPKIDPLTGEMFVFRYMMEAPFLTWSVLDRDGVVIRADSPVPGVDRSSMIHDMALTRTAIVLVLAPLFFDISAALRGGSVLSWEPDKGTRIAIIPRDGGRIQWATDDAFWLWHTANAYDLPSRSGGEDATGPIALDFVQLDHPGMGLVQAPDNPALVRAVIDPLTGKVSRQVFERHSVEFPRIDDRLIGSAHDVIAVGSDSERQQLPGGPFDAIRWYSTQKDTSVQWAADGLVVGEPAFAPRPGDPDPDHGWWITFATALDGSASCLLVIPASDPASGPIARVEIPVRVPLGLHGNWLPTQE